MTDYFEEWWAELDSLSLSVGLVCYWRTPTDCPGLIRKSLAVTESDASPSQCDELQIVYVDTFLACWV